MTRQSETAVSSDGRESGRFYSEEELRAAVRRGLATRTTRGNNGGPIFWASGPYWPNKVRQMLHDYALLSIAMEREWPRHVVPEPSGKEQGYE